MGYKPIREIEKYDENPFIDKAIEEVRSVKKMQMIKPRSGEVQMIVSDAEGEPIGHTAFMRYVEVDEEKFAKVYLSNFSAFFDLNKPAIRVFGYILNQLKPNSDRFYFHMDECKEHTGYKGEKSVIDGLVKLIDAGIIARSKKNYLYYVNPMVVFNGSRITFAKSYIKKSSNGQEAVEPTGINDLESLNNLDE